MKLVFALGRAAKHSPAKTIRQRRPDHIAPNARFEVAVFIEVNPVKAQPPHCVCIVRAKQHDLCAVDQFHHQVGFVDVFCNWGSVVLEVVPCHPLGLASEWGNISVLGAAVAFCNCPLDHIIDCRHGLTGPSVGNQA